MNIYLLSKIQRWIKTGRTPDDPIKKTLKTALLGSTLLGVFTASLAGYTRHETHLPSVAPSDFAINNLTRRAGVNLSGKSRLTVVAEVPGAPNKIAVGEQNGRIRIIENLRGDDPTFSTLLSLNTLSRAESGLLGLAFHPDYTSPEESAPGDNNDFYVFYVSGEDRYNVYSRVSRFTDKGNVDETLATEEILISQYNNNLHHFGGDIHFGPDNYLYISVGDSAGGVPQEVENSQRIDKDFFSGILRIDVDRNDDNLEPNSHPSIIDQNGNSYVKGLGAAARYKIPKDNPFIGLESSATNNMQFNQGMSINADAVRTEFVAIGFRNPWRMSFDSETDDLWIGDVGQFRREEINILPDVKNLETEPLSVKRRNYGWPYYEGSLKPSTIPG